MIFVTADSDRTRLEKLTRMLVSAFPGSTIFQHTDPLRASPDVLSHKVAAVFLAADPGERGGLELMELLRRRREDVPVYILSDHESQRTAAIEAGARGFLRHPVSEENLKDALLQGGFCL